MRGANYASGLEGEDRALRCLEGLGMTLKERRYRGGDGEVDLVMADGDTLVFVEVKYRPAGRAGDGLMAVTAVKRRRLVHAAQVSMARFVAFRMLISSMTSGPIKHVSA